MDLQMPVMDGLTAAGTLRQTTALDAMPIIAMTANVMASDREACLRVGMNDHVGKPFELPVLVQTLVRHTGWTPHAEPAATGAASAPAAVLDDLPWPPGVDVPGALHRMGGNVGLLQRATAAFVQDARTLPARVSALIKSGALADARRELHTIKGLSASLGINELALLASNAEKLAIAPSEQSALQAACDTFSQHLGQMLPALVAVAERLAVAVKQSEAATRSEGAGLAAAEKLQVVASLHKLLAALEVSDMAAMEIHADLRQTVDDALGESMQALDSAMADLDFELAATECGNLIKRWS